MVELHLISWNVGFHSRIGMFYLECDCEVWSMIIAVALRWGVASVGVISTGCSSPYTEQPFRCKKYTSGRHSSEAAIVKKARLYL